MTLAPSDMQHRRLRAPARSGEALIDPPFNEAGVLLGASEAVGYPSLEINGRPISELQTSARRHLLEAAYRYTTRYRDARRPSLAAPILMAGHQPELFHAGVWFKNFALAALGHRHDAACVNLLIDNDTCSAPSIRVPTGSVESPRVEAIAFDAPSEVIPYEERTVRDREPFRSFGRRVRETINPLVSAPLIEPLWPMAVEALEQTEHVGRAIAQARHRLEADLGLDSLELPLSRVCQSEAFAHFVLHLLRELPRLREIYNDSAAEYRRIHRIRSHSHPVPDLAADGEWLEAPFWLWTADHPRRRRLFARRRGEFIEVTDRRGVRFSLNTSGGGAEQIQSLAEQQIKLRPRALITTMYSRLLLSDLFLHGIGGAKYDALTDAIARRFFGAAPPPYMTVTATLRLPIERPRASADDLRRVERQLRELRYHGEHYLPPDAAARPEVAQLVADKRRWIDADPPRGEGLPRRRAIEGVNRQLQPLLAPHREALLSERREISESLLREKLLGSREYAFCLFPRESVSRLLESLS